MFHKWVFKAQTESKMLGKSQDAWLIRESKGNPSKLTVVYKNKEDSGIKIWNTRVNSSQNILQRLLDKEKPLIPRNPELTLENLVKPEPHQASEYEIQSLEQELSYYEIAFG